MKHFGKKVRYKDWSFDSEKERDFFIRYIESSGYKYKVHPHYKVVDKFPVGGLNQQGITYAPDFVVYGDDGEVEHVYDVKSGINQDAVSRASKIRFKLFMLRTGIPVESLYPGLLTEKQKDCPYCHGAKNLLRSNDGQPVDGNIVYINDNGYLNLKTDYDHVYRKINYCPMCGRPLNKN